MSGFVAVIGAIGVVVVRFLLCVACIVGFVILGWCLAFVASCRCCSLLLLVVVFRWF